MGGWYLTLSLTNELKCVYLLCVFPDDLFVRVLCPCHFWHLGLFIDLFELFIYEGWYNNPSTFLLAAVFLLYQNNLLQVLEWMIRSHLHTHKKSLRRRWIAQGEFGERAGLCPAGKREGRISVSQSLQGFPSAEATAVTEFGHLPESLLRRC